MYTGIITVPKATLYESITNENGCPQGKNVSDELLSGWIVSILQEWHGYLKIITHYGYSGWLKKCTVQPISSEYIEQQNNYLQTALTCFPMVDVLKEPRVQSTVLSTLFMGSVITLCQDPSNDWQKIKTADGTCGYVPYISLLHQANTNCSQQLRSAILSYAMSYLGTQYRWGGKTHEGIDCSGLTFMSYYMCGILIYRDAVIKPGYPVKEIPFSQIKPADLLYFPGHVALYLGNEKYIHSTGNPKSFGCVINSLSPKDNDYRADLAENLLAVGSVFTSEG